MTKSEALAIFERLGTRNIIVESKSGKKYGLNADIVEAEDDANPYVYAESLQKNGPLNRRGTSGIRWMFLRNLTYVSPWE